eukprot:Blabericola_migrator_1__2126@NODE_1588_length_4223_cov_110_912175_g1038_i0_p3_GENE_NODE_1588_length_4223_cov_110_912175_g1038_i0NODE_1588_length_4223_cov_110_912175_g1038_i0_p3_ORF_typecomplete_len177_score40_05Inhibitor_Mig6/PF11555_8/4e02Inhibitor_Mig6/PF11555_8/1_2e03Inhibitor_Mig6/PF11555_8/1_9_NODE_1588_length_4223_cov_110_912175_g1038_i031553685
MCRRVGGRTRTPLTHPVTHPFKHTLPSKCHLLNTLCLQRRLEAHDSTPSPYVGQRIRKSNVFHPSMSTLQSCEEMISEPAPDLPRRRLRQVPSRWAAYDGGRVGALLQQEPWIEKPHVPPPETLSETQQETPQETQQEAQQPGCGDSAPHLPQRTETYETLSKADTLEISAPVVAL